MKKVFGVTLLSLFLLQIGGGYIYFVARLSAIQLEMREQLRMRPDHELTLLVLTDTEYEEAIADDHEVKVDDKMYDVARIERKDGKVLVYALHDAAEDSLLSLVKEIVSRSTNDKKPVPNQFIQLLSLHFILFENEFPQNSSVSITHASGYLCMYFNYTHRIDSPPPQFQFSMKNRGPAVHLFLLDHV